MRRLGDSLLTLGALLGVACSSQVESLRGSGRRRARRVNDESAVQFRRILQSASDGGAGTPNCCVPICPKHKGDRGRLDCYYDCNACNENCCSCEFVDGYGSGKYGELGATSDYGLVCECDPDCKPSDEGSSSGDGKLSPEAVEETEDDCNCHMECTKVYKGRGGPKGASASEEEESIEPRGKYSDGKTKNYKGTDDKDTKSDPPPPRDDEPDEKCVKVCEEPCPSKKKNPNKKPKKNVDPPPKPSVKDDDYYSGWYDDYHYYYRRPPPKRTTTRYVTYHSPSSSPAAPHHSSCAMPITYRGVPFRSSTCTCHCCGYYHRRDLLSNCDCACSDHRGRYGRGFW